jgi:hypothetical protein
MFSPSEQYQTSRLKKSGTIKTVYVYVSGMENANSNIGLANSSAEGEAGKAVSHPLNGPSNDIWNHIFDDLSAQDLARLAGSCRGLRDRVIQYPGWNHHYKDFFWNRAEGQNNVSHFCTMLGVAGAG